MIEPAYRPSQVTARVVSELVRRFGAWSAVPVEFQEFAWIIHMRMVEADQDVDYLARRVAAYLNEDPPPEPPSIAGEETGDF